MEAEGCKCTPFRVLFALQLQGEVTSTCQGSEGSLERAFAPFTIPSRQANISFEVMLR